MTTKYILWKRLFNANPEQKNVKILVARWGSAAKAEAEFCLNALQKEATTLLADSPLGKFRYTLQIIPDAPGKQFAGLQIDTTRCRKTGRAIAYELTWDIKHGQSHMLAYHKLYGSIRATVDDTIEARQFFCRAIKRVWPNASLSTK